MALIDTAKFLAPLQNVKIGGIGDNFAFPPTDDVFITTNHYDAAGRFTGQDYAIVSLTGTFTVIAVIISLALLTYFILKRRQ